MTRRNEGNQSGTTKERPAITVDIERYTRFLEGTDLTEEQKSDLIQAHWNIIVQMVMLGFGVHPVQQVSESCGKSSKTPIIPPILGEEALEWTDQKLENQFSHAADGSVPEAARRIRK